MLKRKGLSRFKLPVAIVAAVVVGELAVWLLRPDVGLSPAQVSESAYFSPGEIARAHDFASTQRLIAMARMMVEAGLLVGLVVFPPRRLMRRLRRMAGNRQLVVAAGVGGGLLVGLVLVGLPLTAIGHRRAVEFGLSTQSWSAWFADQGKSAAIGAALAALGGMTAVTLMRRFGRRWWIPGSLVAVGISIVFVWLAPVMLAPLFNRFEPLRDQPTKRELIQLAKREGVKVDDVQVVDASRRTSAVNAYVTGIGSTKRIVLYDTLLERYSPSEVRSVVAHELAHVAQDDIWRGLGWLALFTPLGMYVAARLTDDWSRRERIGTGSPESLVPLALALALVSFAGVVIFNQLSRSIEAKADQLALESTREPAAYIELTQRLTRTNLSEPSPPDVLHMVFGTHPTPVERVGAAVEFERMDEGRPPTGAR